MYKMTPKRKYRAYMEDMEENEEERKKMKEERGEDVIPSSNELNRQ